MNKFHNLSTMFLLAAAILLGSFLFQAQSLKFSYDSFKEEDENKTFTLYGSDIYSKVIQLTPDSHGYDMRNRTGRTWYYKPFKLWSKKKNVTASFNTTFVLNISPNGTETQAISSNGTATQADPKWGHGIAFILSREKGFIPKDSHGEWLGIVNETTNGTKNNIVAVEFDTDKSYREDVDGNHVGIDVNSINSIVQEPLTPHGVNLSSRDDVTATLMYNGISKELLIYVFMTKDGRNSTPIIRLPLNLSDHLPQQVYVGFSASTGEYPELNCIKSWNFTSTEIDDDDNLLWVLWIVIPIVLLVRGGPRKLKPPGLKL